MDALAGKAFSRIADAQQTKGNDIRLLRDGPENFPAWLAAIGEATRTVHLENYILQEDATGQSFADALIAAVGRGVKVRVLYDWLGCKARTSRAFWDRLRAASIEVRCYNPPRFDSPLGWISRDHRKLLCVDGEVGFTGGLCIGHDWMGDPARKIMPWRDTAVSVRGPAVAHLEAAFADSWASVGKPLPPSDLAKPDHAPKTGGLLALVIPGRPDSMGLYRLEQLIADVAERTLWIADAYFVATTGYVRALTDAARDGVDVRLLVPGSGNFPVVQALSRAGYRPLLEAGVRVFEWNGPMMHAKTAVADGCWARVGSSNSNLSSWIANRELDIAIQDRDFAAQMEAMYEEDLASATEIVLTRGKVRRTARVAKSKRGGKAKGRTGRAVAGAVGFGSALSATLSQHRTLGPAEARVLAVGATLLLLLAVVGAFFPAVLAYPLALLAAWVAATLFIRAWKLRIFRFGKEKKER